MFWRSKHSGSTLIKNGDHIIDTLRKFSRGNLSVRLEGELSTTDLGKEINNLFDVFQTFIEAVLSISQNPNAYLEDIPGEWGRVLEKIRHNIQSVIRENKETAYQSVIVQLNELNEKNLVGKLKIIQSSMFKAFEEAKSAIELAQENADMLEQAQSAVVEVLNALDETKKELEFMHGSTEKIKGLGKYI